MTDIEQELHNLLAEALDFRVPRSVEHALWRIKTKRALARSDDPIDAHALRVHTDRPMRCVNQVGPMRGE